MAIGNKKLEFNYEPHMGICGILRPTGRFTHCKYGQHSKFLNKIKWDIREKCICFSSLTNGNGCNSAVCYEDWSIGITKKQYNWIIEHKEYLDDIQLMCLDIVFDGYVKILDS